MKTNDTPTTPPAFDAKSAVAVPSYRHEPTGRTVSFEQGDALFSATGLFIAIKAAPAAPAP